MKNNPKSPNVGPKSRKSKIIDISEEDTCMETSRRTTRKMNSRSKNLTKMVSFHTTFKYV